jgi:hypothetical protein
MMSPPAKPPIVKQNAPIIQSTVTQNLSYEPMLQGTIYTRAKGSAAKGDKHSLITQIRNEQNYAILEKISFEELQAEHRLSLISYASALEDGKDPRTPDLAFYYTIVALFHNERKYLKLAEDWAAEAEKIRSQEYPKTIEKWLLADARQILQSSLEDLTKELGIDVDALEAGLKAKGKYFAVYDIEKDGWFVQQ